MKIYQAQLPMTTRRLKPLTPLPPPRPSRPFPDDRLQTTDDLARSLRHRIEFVLLSGFWFCRDCDGMCERIEGEQGMPAHCDRCGSYRIEWNPPVDQLVGKEAV